MRNNQTYKIVLTAILSALVVVFAFIPIKIGIVEITLTIIPIAIGSIVLGPTCGLILGAVFGLTSFAQCFGYSPFGVELLSISWWKTFIMCVPTRILAGVLPALIHQGIAKIKNGELAADIVACILVPLFNTIFFTFTLVLLFYKTEYIQGFVSTLNAPNPFIFIILFVGINGLIELLTGIIVSFPVVKALKKSLE